LELIDTFAESSKQSIEQIATALAANDIATVQRAAHSLKGASGSIGATTSRMLAAELEDAAKNNNTAQVALLFEALRSEIARANEYMHDKLSAA
jgi:HPt (histidine-containing phosphotransfer) domain-containing protein